MKIKIWFCNILDRQANFGRGSRDFGPGWGKKAAPRKKKKYAVPLKKYCAATQWSLSDFLIWCRDQDTGKLWGLLPSKLFSHLFDVTKRRD